MVINYELIETIQIVLEGIGWKKTIDKKNYPFVIFEKNNEDIQFKIPRSSTLKYDGANELIEDVIRFLSEELNEGYEDLVFKLSNPDVTTLEFRYNSSSTKNGTIPTDVMEDLAKQIPRMISDTYLNMEIRKPFRKVFPTKNKSVQEMLGKINYGQSKRGSYIVTVHIDPIIKETMSGGILEEKESVTINRENIALSAVLSTIQSLDSVVETYDQENEESESEEALKELIKREDHTLSVNFVDSLSQIKLEEDSEIEVTGYSPLVVKGKYKEKTKYQSKKYSPFVKKNIETFVEKYKKITDEIVTYIGKFSGFETKKPEPDERDVFWVGFYGYNVDLDVDSKEKLLCELTYNDEQQDLINGYIRDGILIKVSGVKSKKKLVNISEIDVVK